MLFNRFQFKLTMGILIALFTLLGLSNYLIYRTTLDARFQALRKSLQTIAKTSALLVDVEELNRVPLNKEGINSPEFQKIAKKLSEVKKVNPQIKYIYTMKKTSRDGMWQFVVDPDSLEEGEETSFPGDIYDASRFPEMLKAFEGASADKKLQKDEWGVFLSGYAPIVDRNGKAVAMIGVDIDAQDVIMMREKIQKRTLMLILIGVFISLFLGFFVSDRVNYPIRRLLEGTRQIAQGDLEHRVSVPDNVEELTELAKAFNGMAKSLKDSRQKLLDYFYDVAQSMVRVMEYKDEYTKGHSEKVARYSEQIAKAMGFDKDTVQYFKRIALLHDIGKVGVQDNVLTKTDKLNDREWDIIKQHPVVGEKILRPVLDDEQMLQVIRGHHERADGKGYPDNKTSDDINVFTAIVSVADAYDAMTSNRSYRKALPQGEAIKRLKEGRGSQFDPKIVDVFVKLLQEDQKEVL